MKHILLFCLAIFDLKVISANSTTIMQFKEGRDNSIENWYMLEECLRFGEDTILVKEGEYWFLPPRNDRNRVEMNEPYGLFINPNNSNRKSLFLLGEGSVVMNIHEDSGGPFLYIADLEKVIVENIAFDGNSYSNRVRFSGKENRNDPIGPQPEDIMTVSNIQRVEVKNCEFRNSPDSGIMIGRCDTVLVVGNRYVNCDDLGIYMSGETKERLVNAVNGIIYDNYILNCTYGGIGLKRRISGARIVGNRILNCGNGITLEYAEDNLPAGECVIVNNYIDSRQIWLEQGHPYPSYAPQGDIAKPLGVGIQLIGSGNIVLDNEILGFRIGVYVRNGQGSIVMSNLIADMNNDEPGTPIHPLGSGIVLGSKSDWNRDGHIDVFMATGTTIVGNEIKNISGHPIFRYVTFGNFVDKNLTVR